MKNLMIAIAFLFTAIILNAQTGSDKLYNSFPSLSSSMENSDLVRLVKSGKSLDSEFFSALSVGYLGTQDHEIYLIGKAITGKVVHLLYGIVSYRERASFDYSMNEAYSSFNSKSHKLQGAGLQNYLTMSGQDALKREGSYEYSNGMITFTLKSTDKSGKLETETNTYKFAKYLEIVI